MTFFFGFLGEAFFLGLFPFNLAARFFRETLGFALAFALEAAGLFISGFVLGGLFAPSCLLFLRLQVQLLLALLHSVLHLPLLPFCFLLVGQWPWVIQVDTVQWSILGWPVPDSLTHSHSSAADCPRVCLADLPTTSKTSWAPQSFPWRIEGAGPYVPHSRGRTPPTASTWTPPVNTSGASLTLDFV